MQHGADEVERPLKTRTDLLADIRVSLGGRAAELLYYGEEGLSTGIQSDLEGAKETARRMVSDFWMQQSVDQGSAEANQAEVNRILTEQMEETTSLLQANRHHLDTVVDALSRQERLTADDLKQILPPIPGKAPAP